MSSRSSASTYDRPIPSKILAKIREDRRALEANLGPADRMRAAYAISLEAQRMFWAGLRARGFAENEIAAIFRTRRP